MNTLLKKTINTALRTFMRQQLRRYGLTGIDTTLCSCLREFVQRDGKRLRPLLFLLAYQGTTAEQDIPPAILTASLAFELIHDFLLVHDDIIDRSPLRRGQPTVHKLLQQHYQLPEANGADLAIIVGDILFTLAIEAFLGSDTATAAQQSALRYLLRATAITGAGEYIDVLNGFQRLSHIPARAIRQTYHYKTAVYTFQAPLICGYLLANGTPAHIRLFEQYGACLGEAFQMHDDLIGLFGNSAQIGKSVLSDIQEGKKTLPLFLAYQKASPGERQTLDRCVGNDSLTEQQAAAVRDIVERTGARRQTIRRVNRLIARANAQLTLLPLQPHYKEQLQLLTAAWAKTS